MSGNLLPWIAIAAAVAVTLYLKGYVKLPVGSQPAAPRENPVTTGNVWSPAPSGKEFNLADLDSLSPYVLGLAFAKATRREAEDRLARQFAEKAGADLHATFTAPFTPAVTPVPNGDGPQPPDPVGF